MGSNKRPDEITQWANAGTNVLRPSNGAISQGFVDDERPGASNFNWPLYNLALWEKHVSNYINGLMQNGVVSDGLNIHHDGGGVLSLWKTRFAITAVNVGAGTFTISGDETWLQFVVGQTFVIDGSTGNDGTYTVAALAPAGVNSDITVEEVIPNPIADGHIYFGGTISDYSGSKLVIDAQMAFHTCSLPVGPGTERTDYVYATYDRATNVTTIAVSEGVPLLDDEIIIGRVQSYNNGGAYQCLDTVDGARSLGPRNTIYVGDGHTSFNSEPLDPDDPIQDAVDKMSERGGGEVVLCAARYAYTLRSQIRMKSGVVIRGASTGTRVQVVDAIPSAFLALGTGGTCNTGGGTSSMTDLGAVDFYDYGIGSRVVITSGADAGTYYIYAITASNQAELADTSGRPVSLTGSLVAAYKLYLSHAGIENMSMKLDGCTAAAIAIQRTYDIQIREISFERSGAAIADCITDGGGAPGTAYNYWTLIKNVTVNSGFTDALDFATQISNYLRINGLCVPSGNVLLNNTAFDVGTIQGIYCPASTATIPGAFRQYLFNPYVRDNFVLRFGDGGDAGIWYDGTDLHVDPRLVGTGDTILDAGDLLLANGHLHLMDNMVTYYGAADDSGIYYTGTNMIINPKFVGTGQLICQGDFYVSAGGDLICNLDNAAVGSTSGFFYLPTVAGKPTGVPTAHGTRAPVCVDHANRRLHSYLGGAWRDVPLDPISMRARRTNALAIGSGAPVQIAYNSVDWDLLGAANYVSATGVWTAPRDMIIRVSASMLLQASNAWTHNENLWLMLQKNGADYARLDHWAAPGNTGVPDIHAPMVSGSTLVSVAVGDTINIDIEHTSGVGENADVGSFGCWLSIEEI